MSNTIYRKYRPKNFDLVIGQDHVKHILIEQLKSNKLSHAYLFTGPRGTGKTTLARIFANSLVNSKDLGEISENNVNIIEIDAASNRGIEEIRELKSKINFAPIGSNFKVYIIDEVHMMTKEAFNALLKTLEEPPQHVIFVLATTEPHKVPVTVLSRVLRFDLHLGSYENLKQKLELILENEKIKYENDAIDLIINKSNGSFRDMESILEKLVKGLDGAKLTRKVVDAALGLIDQEYITEFNRILKLQEISLAVKWISNLKNDGINLVQLAHQIIEDMRMQIYTNVLEKSKSDTLDIKTAMLVIKKLNNFLVKSHSNLNVDLLFEIAIWDLFSSPTESDNMATNELKIQGNKKVTLDKEVQKITKKETILDKPSNTNSLDTSKWNEIISNLAAENIQLKALLINSNVDFINDELVIKVAFEFHRKKLNESKSKQILNRIFETAWGKPMNYSIIVEPKLITQERNHIQQDNSNANLVESVLL